VAEPVLDLREGEAFRAHVHVSFRGAATASTRATFALGSARMRQKAYEDWRNAVEQAGFPTAGAEMVLALTDQRLFACRTTFWTSRPADVGGTMDVSRIHSVATSRHGMVTGLAFALTNGQVIEVEAMRGGAVRRFAHAVQLVLDQRSL
jgi:hypothetical protein